MGADSDNGRGKPAHCTLILKVCRVTIEPSQVITDHSRASIGGLGAQVTTVLDRIFDPILILPDRQGILAPTTLTTDTTPDAARTSGVSDVIIES